MVEEAIRAAGGVVLRRGGDGRVEVVVVHRPKYDDWALPKGKLDREETEEHAAQREVLEETGIHGRLGPVAGRIRYRDRHDRPKVVTYFFITPEGGAFTPNDEVDELRWLTLDDAAGILSYERDRDLVTRLAANPPPI
jgi:8-oxo-dGTP diphosphatase